MTHTRFIEPEIEYHKNFAPYKKRPATDYLVVHCSATKADSSYSWKTIDQMHRQKGWLGIGYHFVIKTDGTIQNGRDIDDVGAHAVGFNERSLGICLIGGLYGKPDFTAKQFDSLRRLLDWLLSKYPEAEVLGHRDLPDVHKECPCFNVKDWYQPPAKYVVFNGGNPMEGSKLDKPTFLKYNGTLEPEPGDLVRIN